VIPVARKRVAAGAVGHTARVSAPFDHPKDVGLAEPPIHQPPAAVPPSETAQPLRSLRRLAAPTYGVEHRARRDDARAARDACGPSRGPLELIVAIWTLAPRRFCAS